MADPVSAIAIGSMVATAAGGATSAAGSLFGGQASAAAANYQAGIAQMNANIARQNAAYEIARGEVEAERSGMKSRFELGQIRATQAAAGGDVNRGSNINVQASQRDVGTYNESLIRNTAQRKAFGFETEAAGDEANAALDRMKGSAAKTASYYQAAGSLLGAAGSVSSQWLKAGQQGVPGFKFASAGDNMALSTDDAGNIIS